MAFSYVNERGVADTKTAGTTLNCPVTANIPVGALVITRAVADNANVTTGPSTTHSMSDSQGNSYTRIVEYTLNPGSGLGVASSLHYSVLTTALTTAGADYVMLTSSNVVARALGILEFGTAGIDGYGSSGVTGTGNSPSVTISSLPSRTYLFIGLPGWEGKSNETLTSEDADYASFTTYIGNTAGGAESCVGALGAYRIATLTGDTYAPVLNQSRDYACVLGYLYEAAAVTNNVVRMVISNA